MHPVRNDRGFFRVETLLLPALLAFAGPPSQAAAGTLASPFVTNPQNADPTALVRCFLTNVGSSPVPVISAGIFDATDGSALTLQADLCSGETLDPGRTCQIGTDFGVQLGHGAFVVKGSAKRLCGICQAITVSGGVQTVHSEAEVR